MASIDEIGQEKQRISERLARLYAERTRLGDQLNELEMAERVLTDSVERPIAPRGEERTLGANCPVGRRGARSPRRPESCSLTLRDACLKAVQAHGEGATPNEILNYLSSEFGMTVRPNHLGAALQRHRRAGQLDNRDQRWYPPSRIAPPITRGTEGSNPYLSSVKSYCEPDSSREKTHWAPALLKTARL